MTSRRTLPTLVIVCLGVLATLIAARAQSIERATIHHVARIDPGLPEPNLDLSVTDEAEYGRLLDAMRAAERVRLDYVRDFVDLDADGVLDDFNGDAIPDARMARPRVVAVVAGILAFTTRNPIAEPCQIDAFAQLYDAALRGFEPNDPDLRRMAYLIPAARYSLPLQSSAAAGTEGCLSGGSLAGTDTNLGPVVAHLLDLEIPAPAGAAGLETRMSTYALSTVRSLDNDPRFADLLVLGFLGRDLNGVDHHALPQALATYLESEGFQPNVGVGVEPRFAGIEAVIAALPQTLAEFEQTSSSELQNAVLAEMCVLSESIQSDIDSLCSIVASLPALTAPGQDRPNADPACSGDWTDPICANAGQNAVTLEEALGNANDAARLAQSATHLAQRRDEAAQSRTGIYANTLLLLQNDDQDVRNLASQSRDFGHLQLDLNGWAAQTKDYIETSAWIGFAAANLVNPLGSVVFLPIAVVKGINTFGDHPSDGEQVFEQMRELREQIEDLRVEMNQRFDRIETQLNQLFVSMVSGMNQLGDSVAEINADVDAIRADVATALSSLSRLEEALYTLAQEEFTNDLMVDADLFLGFTDLPYAGTTSYAQASNSFFTFATVTATKSAFVGGLTPITLDNARDVIGSGAVSRDLRGLRDFPQQLGMAPLWSQSLSVPAPAAWAQAVAAYTQLARENPWYFAYQRRVQIDSPFRAVPDLDQIITKGLQLTDALAAARSQELFDTLFDLYETKALDLQDELDEAKTAFVNAYPSGLGGIDPWVAPSLNDAPSVASIPRTGTLSLDIPSGQSAWNLLPGVVPAGYAARLLDADSNGAWSFTWTSATGTNNLTDLWITHSGNDGNGQTFSQTRRVKFTISIRSNGAWQPFALGDVAATANMWVFMADELFSRQSLQGLNFYDRQVPPFTIDGDLRYSFSYDNLGSSAEDDQTQVFVDQTRAANQDAVWATLLSKVAGGPLEPLADSLGNLEALIDAYATMAFPSAMRNNQILLAGLRGTPTADSISLDPAAIPALLASFAGAGDDGLYQSVVVDLASPGSTGRPKMIDRVAAVRAEIDLAIQSDTTEHDYLTLSLTELRDRRDRAFDLAHDDTYALTPGQTLVVDAQSGVLANDVAQPYRRVSVDTDFTLDPTYMAPQHGTLVLFADGSFEYTPGPNFTGRDTFTYRAKANVLEAPCGTPDCDGQIASRSEFPNGDVLSEPATVAIVQPATVPPPTTCPGDIDGDNDTDVFDFNIFAQGFGSSGLDPFTGGDLDGDGDVDVFDFNIFGPDFGCTN